MKRFLVITLISALASSYLTSHASNEIDSLITVLDENLQPTQKILVLSKLMDHYQVLGFDKSFQYANQLRDLVNEFGDVVDKAKVTHSFGDIYLLDGQVDLALVNYLSSIKFYKKAGLISETAHVLTDIAYIFYKVQEYSKAKEYYLDALVLYEQNGLKKEIIKTYYNLSTCFRQKKKYSEALKYTYQALKLAEKINDQVSINKIYNYIGIIHYEKGDYPLARKNYLNSIENIGEKENKTLRLAYGYNNIGETYLEQKNFSNAYDYFQKALTEKQKLNKPTSTAITLKNIGMLHLMETRVDSAIIYLERALSLIDLSAAKFNNNLKNVPSLLITAYQQKGNPDKKDYKRLLELNREYIEYIERSSTDNNQRLLDLAMTNGEEISKAQYHEQKAKSIQNRSLWIMGFSILAILGLLALLYYRERRFKNFIKQMWNDIKDV